MIAALLLFASAATGESSGQRLSQCAAERDKQCVTRELKAIPPNASPEYLAAAAQGYLLLGRNKEAITAIGNAVRNKPGDYSLLTQQGSVYQRTGYQVEAIESFLLASKIRQSSGLFYQIGMSFFLLREYERAGRHFTHAIQLDAQNHRAEFMLGVIDVVKDHNDEGARKHMERALALDPVNPHYLLHYGIVLSELGDPGAVAVLEKAVVADPSNALGHYNLGRVYRRAGDAAKARQELETAVRMRPQLARAYYQLAAVYRELGDGERARQATEQFTKFRDQDRDDDPVDDTQRMRGEDQASK